MSRFRPSRNYVSGKVVFDGGPVDITGDLVVSGSITANQYNVNVINTNVTHIDADGDTKFGDSADDTHQFTGSVFINGPLSASSIIGGGATTPGAPLTSVQYNDGGAFAGDADFVWDNTANALTVTGDITASSNISGAFFYGDGSGLTGITATAAPAGSNTEIQFNADGVTAADADLVWLTGSNTLNVNGYISSSALFVSSSNSAETLLRVDSHNKPYLFTVDASASIDGKARVMIRNSNDDTAAAFNNSNRGLLHLEQLQTTTVNEAQGVSIWSDTTGTIASQLRLVTFSPPGGVGSEVLFGTSNGHMAGPFVSDNQALGRLAYGGFDGNGFYYGALIYARATEAWNFSAQNGTELQFFLVPTGKGSSTNLAERIRFTSEGHLIVFPYSASNNDALPIETNYDKSAGAPAIQVYGPSLFGSSSLNTHTFTGSVNISGALSASSNISGAFFYGDGSNLTNLPAGSPGGLDTQIQFNDAGTFNGDAEFTWNKTTNTLTVTGDISASVNVSGSDFYGGGANLTDLNASNISAGTLNNARLPATISVTNITASALVSSSFFYGDGSNLTNLPSAAITTYNSASAGRVITSVNATTVEGEPNLTFDNTTLVITGDVSGSGNVSGSAFYGDGSNLTGLARDFGPSATDPVGSPNAGDFYYNTVLNMTMHYDSSRTKWLSAETSELKFGRNGNTGPGAYYKALDGRAYTATNGRYAEHSGTVVSISYTRDDVDAAIFNVTSDGTTFSFLSSSAAAGNSTTLDDDFSPNTVLGVKNQSADGNTTTDVLGVVRMKWRI